MKARLQILVSALLLPAALVAQEPTMSDLSNAAGQIPVTSMARPRFGGSYRKDILDILSVVAATRDSVAKVQALESAERRASAALHDEVSRRHEAATRRAATARSLFKSAGALALLGTGATLAVYDGVLNSGNLTKAYAAPALKGAAVVATAYGVHQFLDSRVPRAPSGVAAVLPSNPDASLTMAAIELLEAEGSSHVADLVSYQEHFTAKVNEIILAAHRDPASRLRVQAASIVFSHPSSPDGSLISALVFQIEGQLVTVPLDSLERYVKDDFRALLATRRVAVEDARGLTVPANIAQLYLDRAKELQKQIIDVEAQKKKVGIWKSHFSSAEGASTLASQWGELTVAKALATIMARDIAANERCAGNCVLSRWSTTRELEQFERDVAAGARVQTQMGMELRRAEKAVELLGLLDKGKTLAALDKIRKLL